MQEPLGTYSACLGKDIQCWNSNRIASRCLSNVSWTTIGQCKYFVTSVFCLWPIIVKQDPSSNVIGCKQNFLVILAEKKLLKSLINISNCEKFLAFLWIKDYYNKINQRNLRTKLKTIKGSLSDPVLSDHVKKEPTKSREAVSQIIRYFEITRHSVSRVAITASGPRPQA